MGSFRKRIWLCSLLCCSVSDSSRGRRTPRLKFSDRSRRPLSFKMTKKKGFMTPERKKKLRTLLRKKAAEELKKEQERKATERQRIIAERCGIKKDIDNASDDELKKIVKEYFDKWFNLEGEMFFLQREVILRDLQINELNMSVSGMKGKFIKPTLKKVSKYENKFAKLQEKAAKFAFANQLKAKDK